MIYRYSSYHQKFCGSMGSRSLSLATRGVFAGHVADSGPAGTGTAAAAAGARRGTAASTGGAARRRERRAPTALLALGEQLDRSLQELRARRHLGAGVRVAQQHRARLD